MTKNKKMIFFVGVLLTFNSFAKSLKTEKFNWNGLEVVYVEDNKLPLYDIRFYFADGAASDSTSRLGETSMTFDLLMSGTRSFNQREISDNLEFFGTSLGFDVTHEYVVGGVGGLIKDIVPTMKQVCHLFDDATYPRKEIKKEKKLRNDSLTSMINSHDSIADRAFRYLSMKGSDVSSPVSGRLKTISRIRQKDLRRKLDYFKKSVKKRLYLSGPREVLKVKDIIIHECGFTFAKNNFVREVAPIKTNSKSEVILVTVPKANQAQVRMGRILNREEVKNIPLLMFTSKFLGGGFTSQLMKSVRTEKGLSYSVGAFAAGQRGYGRSGISTFTKSETIIDLIETIKKTLSNVSQKKFLNEEFEASRGYLVGSYPFNFESSSGFMENLIQLDHAGIPWSDFYELPNRIKNIKVEEVAEMTNKLFSWDKQVIVVLGEKKLRSTLKKKYGRVKVIPWKNFL